MKPPFDVPQSWIWATLGEIADVVGGVTKDSKRQKDPDYVEVPYLRVANVQRGMLDLSNVAAIKVPPDKAIKLRLKRGDVLLNEGGDRDKLGRGWIWEDQIPNCIHQNHVFRARVLEGLLDPRLLAWHANGFGQQWFQQHGIQSVNLASISLSKIKELPVPVPPLAEQRRIVAALEGHLSRLDVGVSGLKKVLARLDGLRESFIERLLFPFLVNSRTLGDLVAEKMINGRSVPTLQGGFPVLRLTALRDDGIALNERKGGAWDAADAAPFLVSKGDFLVSRGNGSIRLVARGGLVDEEPDPVAFPDTLIRVRPDEGQVHPEFLALVWNSRHVRRQIEKSARTTAGIYKVNQAILAKISIPVPSLTDQKRIVDESGAVTSEVRRLSAVVHAADARARQLRASLLTEAFAGRLVPQDPSDEPASELLARIRAERAAADPQKRAPRQRAGRSPRTRKEPAAPPTRVTGDDYEQGVLPL